MKVINRVNIMHNVDRSHYTAGEWDKNMLEISMKLKLTILIAFLLENMYLNVIFKYVNKALNMCISRYEHYINQVKM